ncbi:hypothetical protein KZZ52_27065 [Dactylosporangium sp. AC04546]|uniref:hypothetical protein n=1 Tax=Dactylosporangium sp. AC04546 TaxID=2862460 RepID=UPI001EDE1359|nr:hypothetical protein [Dactylosporangium sp. AC04546]WVK88927.1 hypothetical protein KZZ52_27065 [Dactylosporangium sp. AC04546]
MELFCVLAIAGLAGFIVWQFLETRNAVDTMTVRSPHDPQQTARIIHDAFTGVREVLWTDTSGPGAINKRRRGKDGGITMSIDIDPLPDGGAKVSMWASQTNVYFGFLVNFAGVVNRRKKAIARLLAA